MINVIQNLLDVKPFLPFSIVLTGGDRYMMSDPHVIALLQTRILYVFPQSDKWEFLYFNRITSVEVKPNAA